MGCLVISNTKSTLSSIKLVLRDAEEKQVIQESVKSWLQKLRDVAYEAEDVLDEFGYEVVRQKVKKINDELAEIKDEVGGLGLLSAAAISTERAPQPSISQDTHAFLNKSEQAIGRDKDVSKVIELLDVSRDDQVLSVFPIVGMGGLGKTTLAKLVVEEIKERKLSEEIIWVCVSQNFNKQRILGEMLQDLSGKNVGALSSLNPIVRQLQEGLQGKKFLLVLDDVWNEEPKEWESLKEELSIVCGSNGNVVMVTTRKRQTASIMETSPRA
ncbi:hypothetical protein Tsubulata_050567 [Turnera subulata]|uniref:NB-ARC domain-containing protein n=1 Tax=Turnera subulata TaxID=218843 RepID=A0A9Q0G4J2_9ROSI|nr:hypothetical protein Tsubulata_050567 [Turnera subulata]